MSERDYAILWIEGVVRKGIAGAGGSVLGGNAVTSTPQHKLDGIEHLAADDTSRLDASTTRHGLMPKGSGNAADVYRGDLSQAPVVADEVEYDPTTSGLAATDVQAAIDEIDATVDGLSAPSLAIDDLTDVDTTSTPPSDGDVLTWAAGLGLWVPGAPTGGGFANPMSAEGDLIVGDTGGSPIRKAVGTDGQVLTADAASTGGMKWATPSGGGGVTWTAPALKPGTPTDDFTAFSGWSAHSNQGSFATGNCIGGGEDWLGSSLDMQFSGQCGTIYKSQSDTDFDFTVGGVRMKGLAVSGSTAVMIGIAALNSSGNGVGVVAYNDGSCYFATITSYSYVTNTDSWSAHGISQFSDVSGDWWFRLKRVSGTWTGYVSQSGRTWDKTFSTRADSIVVAQLHFGILYNSASSYSGRVIADYYQKDV